MLLRGLLVAAFATLTLIVLSFPTLDLWLVVDVNSLVAPHFAVPLEMLTNLGGTVAIILFAAAASIYLRNLLPLVSVLVAQLVVQVIKNLVERSRPPVEGRLDEAGGMSFPSGHSTSVMVVAFSVWLLTRHDLPRNWQIALLATPVVIGISRVAMAVHYPTDVVAGWALGCLLALTLFSIGTGAVRLAQKLRPAPAPRALARDTV